MKPLSARRALLFTPVALASCLALGAAASCGARTGLLAEEPQGDAGNDQEFFPDVMDATEDIPFIDVMRPDVPVINPCPDAAATLIYVIGENNNLLYSFDPADPSKAFTPVGVISCPGAVGKPFSMAVDREGIAYVVFAVAGNSDELATGLFRVSTKTAECETTTYDPTKDRRITFGMGFVANVGDSGDAGETLFVSEDQGGGDDVLATIDTTTFALKKVGAFNPAVLEAELTGTGAGQLFAFQPIVPETSGAFIFEIDPTTAKVIAEDPLPGLMGGGGWAFGFWGGKFYLFTATAFGNTTTVVTEFDPYSKTLTEVARAQAGVAIVGAGVSTCAPQN